MTNKNEQDFDEISLRELIDILWRGKKLIIGLTVIAMVISLVFSFFIIAPTYEVKTALIFKNTIGTSSVSIVGTLIDDQDVSIATLLSAFDNVLTGPKILEEVRKISPDWENINSSNLKDLISVRLADNTTNVNITTLAATPRDAAALTNLVIIRLQEFVEEQNYDFLATKLKIAKFQIETDINLYQEKLNKSEKQLAELDKVLVYKKSITEDPYLQELAAALGNTSVINISNLSIESEQPNPAYIRVLDDITSNRLSLNNLESQYNEILKAEVNLNIMSKESGMKVTKARDLIEPEKPIGPRKALNLAIAMVLGLMAGVFIVFMMEYWMTSGEIRQSGNSNISMN